MKELVGCEKSELSGLKADPSEVERIARERYNFARPGDIIVNLQD